MYLEDDDENDPARASSKYPTHVFVPGSQAQAYA